MTLAVRSRGCGAHVLAGDDISFEINSQVVAAVHAALLSQRRGRTLVANGIDEVLNFLMRDVKTTGKTRSKFAEPLPSKLRVLSVGLEGVVQTHIHYCDALVAANSAVYVVPEARVGRVALKLLRYAEIGLKAQGVKKIYYHVKQEKDFGRLLGHLGYRDSERLFAKLVQ